MANPRTYVVVALIVFNFLFRYLTVRLVAADLMRGMCIRLFRAQPASYDVSRHFRVVGWDLASASLGLVVAAMTTPASKLMKLSATAGDYGPIVAVVCALAFLLLYAFATLVRYGLLETAESCQRLQWLFGGVCWMVGVLSLGAASALL